MVRVARGLAWFVFSPLAFLMVSSSNRGSDRTYLVMAVLTGAWTVGGMASGVGTMWDAAWAKRVQTVLKWSGFVFYSVAGIGLLVYAVILPLASAERLFVLGIGAGVLCTGLPFLYFALRRST